MWCRDSGNDFSFPFPFPFLKISSLKKSHFFSGTRNINSRFFLFLGYPKISSSKKSRFFLGTRNKKDKYYYYYYYIHTYLITILNSIINLTLPSPAMISLLVLLSAIIWICYSLFFDAFLQCIILFQHFPLSGRTYFSRAFTSSNFVTLFSKSPGTYLINQPNIGKFQISFTKKMYSSVSRHQKLN